MASQRRIDDVAIALLHSDRPVGAGARAVRKAPKRTEEAKNRQRRLTSKRHIRPTSTGEGGRGPRKTELGGAPPHRNTPNAIPTPHACPPCVHAFLSNGPHAKVATQLPCHPNPYPNSTSDSIRAILAFVLLKLPPFTHPVPRYSRYGLEPLSCSLTLSLSLSPVMQTPCDPVFPGCTCK